jgi:hypothetical protein
MLFDVMEFACCLTLRQQEKSNQQEKVFARFRAEVAQDEDGETSEEGDLDAV